MELTRHGKPVAVIIGIDSFNELKHGSRSFLGDLARFKEEWGADNGEADAADPFAGIRDKDPGRDVSL